MFEFRRCIAGSRAIDLVLDGGGGFALSGAEVVEFGAADSPLALNFNFRNARRVNRENTLDTLAIRNSADGEVLVESPPLAADHDAGINLNTLLVAFNDAGVDFNSVADIERGDVGFVLFGFDFEY